MKINLPSSEERVQLLNTFIETAQFYDKKDLLFSDTLATYCFTAPPFDRNSLFVGAGPVYDSKVYLFSDYFVFATSWTADNEARKNHEFNWYIKSFAAELVTEYLDDLTYGVSSLVEDIGKSVLKFRQFDAGRKLRIKLANPWSMIIPLDSITNLELLTYGRKNNYGCLHIKADVPFEGEKDIYVNLSQPRDGKKWATKIQERIIALSLANRLEIREMKTINIYEHSEDLLSETKYLASIRLLRTTTSWGIHGAIVVLGILALPIVFVCFLAAALFLMPLVIVIQGFRFIWVFLGFNIGFPQLWNTLFHRRTNTSEEPSKNNKSKEKQSNQEE